MAEETRDVTREEIEAMAAKLGPAVESLTDGEREIFAAILERAGHAGAEVSGFSVNAYIKFKGDVGAMAGWSNPLSAQLAGAAGLGGGVAWVQKEH